MFVSSRNNTETVKKVEMKEAVFTPTPSTTASFLPPRYDHTKGKQDKKKRGKKEKTVVVPSRTSRFMYGEYLML